MTSSNDHNRNIFPPLLIHEASPSTKQRGGKRRSTTHQKPKKQPQRGPGVAQLERLINTPPRPLIPLLPLLPRPLPASYSMLPNGLHQWFQGQNGNINFNSCLSHHLCGSCHKKKRINGDNFACFGPNFINGSNGYVSYNTGNNLGDQDFTRKHDFLVGNTSQGFEAVKEYEFFPVKKGEKSISSSSSSGEAYCVSTTTTGFESSTSIDLTLKLY